MGRFVPLAACAVGALYNVAVAAQDIPPCIPGCATSVRADFAKLACRDAGDAACLCANKDFFFGVRDCGAHCGANDSNVRQFLVSDFCAAALPASAASPMLPSSQATPTSESTSTLASTQSSSAHASTPAPPTNPAVAPTSLVASTSTQPSLPSSTDSASGPSKVSEVAASAMSSEAGGLSQASVVGIGVGIGAAVVALAAVVPFFLLRVRKRVPRPAMEISHPLPGSGRAYAGRDRQSYEKYGNEIELTTNRYEDMVPRQQPRTIV